jgi:excisionase family DNA binding protein
LKYPKSSKASRLLTLILASGQVFDRKDSSVWNTRWLNSVAGEMNMGRFSGLEEMHNGPGEARSTDLPGTADGRYSNVTFHGIESLLTTKEASQVLKIHPKVLERMAKRGEVPALKVGKFWRYRATALDAWINSRLQSSRQPCRMKTSF